MSQNDYDNWTLQQRIEDFDRYNMNRIFEGEKYFIDKFAKNSILDIGCGTGHRLFPYYEEKGIEFLGIEKFENIIEGSKYKKYIIQGDLFDGNFINLPKLRDRKFDLCGFFEGVICAFLDPALRKIAWENIKKLSEKKCKYVLVDTLCHFSWFKTAETGRIVQLLSFLPPQYFYSEKEIKKIFEENSLKIEEEREENVGPYRRVYYLLKAS